MKRRARCGNRAQAIDATAEINFQPDTQAAQMVRELPETARGDLLLVNMPNSIVKARCTKETGNDESSAS